MLVQEVPAGAVSRGETQVDTGLGEDHSRWWVVSGNGTVPHFYGMPTARRARADFRHNHVPDLCELRAGAVLQQLEVGER